MTLESSPLAGGELSVIVVSYNVREILLQALASLFKSLQSSGLTASTEVIVVDNASSDASAAAVTERYPGVAVIANKVNAGFASATNQGIRASRGRYVWLLNPDTLVLDDAPAAFVKFMDTHQSAAVCGGRLVWPDGRVQHSCFSLPTLPMTFLDFFPINHRLVNSRLNGRYPSRQLTHPCAIGHPLGASMVVRRSAVEQVGLLDDAYFMYCEEIDWCYRFQQAGWDVLFTPAATIVHFGAQSSGQQSTQMLVELHRSRDRFFRKHYGALYAGVAREIVRLGLWRDARRQKNEAAAGRITPRALAERLSAYAEINRL